MHIELQHVHSLRGRLPQGTRQRAAGPCRSPHRGRFSSCPVQHCVQAVPMAHVDPSTKEAFRELGLDKIPMKRIRVRQHVNPLKRELQVRHGPLDWASVFDDPSLPLVVDVGSGYGRFAIKFAHENPTQNVLGIEIRTPTVDRANLWAQTLQLHGRTHFIVANATISMRSLLDTYPGPIRMLCVQFPDPHFKARHQKRHTVQREFCEDAAHILEKGGRVWLQSDVHLAARHMRNMFFETVPSCFAPDPSLHYKSAPLPSPTEPSRETRAVDAGRSFESSDSADHQALGVDSSKFLGWEQAGWLDCSPLSVPTEREVHTQERGGSVWRFMLVRL